MTQKQLFFWVGLGLVTILGSSLLIQQWFNYRANQQALHQFTQIIQTNSQPLDGGGRSLVAQADFNDIRFHLTENQVLVDSNVIPLITVPVTTPQTSFLLVLAVRTKRQTFSSFGQNSLISDPQLFATHVQKVFTQRGICQIIIELDHHESIQNDPTSWSEMLKHETGLHISKKFGRVVLPTNFNILSCQN